MALNAAEEISKIDWTAYKTAYGTATSVPDQLLRLRSPDAKIAFEASHELWCGLCHQHAYVSSAALPALPFLLDTFNQASEDLQVELMDIFYGFAVCTTPARGQQTLDWQTKLRKQLHAEAERFERLKSSPIQHISDFAVGIIDELNKDFE